LGYASGERDINRAKCRIKLCCFKDRKLETCADCPEFPGCEIYETRFKKGTQNYKKYSRALKFIREHGYEKFMEQTRCWNGPSGKLK
jgi:hypothetical protein